MAISPSFKFYTDAALTTEVSTALTFTATPGVTANVDKQIFFGSTIVQRQVEDSTNPGVDQLQAIVSDLDVGNGVDAVDFVVADTQLNLDTAISQSLDLGAVVASGVANAVEIWIRYTPPVGFEGNDNQLRVSVSNIVETDLS